MAVPAIVASTLSCNAAAGNPVAPTLSATSGGKPQAQVGSLVTGVLSAVPTTASSTLQLREHSSQERIDLGQASAQQQQQVSWLRSKAEARAPGLTEGAPEVLTGTPKSTGGGAAVEGGSVDGGQGGEPVQGRAGEEPAVKRKKSRDMAVLAVQDAEAAPVTGCSAELKQRQSKGCMASQGVGDIQQADEEQKEKEQHEVEGQVPPPPEQGEPVLGTLAALRGYFLSTSGRIVFAVGGFGSRQSPPSGDPRSQDSRDLQVPSRGGTPRPSRGVSNPTAYVPHAARHVGVARGFPAHAQGPGAWWSESSEDVVAAPNAAGEESRGADASQQLPEEKERREPASLTPAATDAEAPRASSGGPAGTPAAFVNEALLRWEQRRAEWRSGARAAPRSEQDQQEQQQPQRGTGRISPADSATRSQSHDHRRSHHRNEGTDSPRRSIRPGTTYEDLLSSSRPFPEPIPLPEMVEFLVDVWREEGLYD